MVKCQPLPPASPCGWPSDARRSLGSAVACRSRRRRRRRVLAPAAASATAPLAPDRARTGRSPRRAAPSAPARCACGTPSARSRPGFRSPRRSCRRRRRAARVQLRLGELLRRDRFFEHRRHPLELRLGRLHVGLGLQHGAGVEQLGIARLDAAPGSSRRPRLRRRGRASIRSSRPASGAETVYRSRIRVLPSWSTVSRISPRVDLRQIGLDRRRPQAVTQSPRPPRRRTATASRVERHDFIRNSNRKTTPRHEDTTERQDRRRNANRR